MGKRNLLTPGRSQATDRRRTSKEARILRRDAIQGRHCTRTRRCQYRSRKDSSLLLRILLRYPRASHHQASRARLSPRLSAPPSDLLPRICTAWHRMSTARSERARGGYLRPSAWSTTAPRREHAPPRPLRALRFVHVVPMTTTTPPQHHHHSHHSPITIIFLS